MNVNKLNSLVAKSDKPEKMQEIIDDLKESGFTDAFNTGREIKLLPDVLRNNERIAAAASGFNSKNSESVLIVVTNERVLLENKKLLFGSNNTDIPLDKINSVSYNTGIMMGKISFTNGADTITISNIQKKDAQPLADAIKRVADDFQDNNNNGQKDINNTSNGIDANKLREMKSLVDDGIISQEEFDAAKKKYLGL